MERMIPLGFKFCPSTKHLIFDYLRAKVLSHPLPCNGVIIENRDLYSDVPWNLLGKHEDWFEFDTLGNTITNTFYAFTKVKKHGERFVRTVQGYGTWKAETGEKEVYGYRCVNGRKEKFIIGHQRLLKFKANHGGDVLRDMHGDWIMHEYSLAGDLLISDLEEIPLAKEIVICKIKQTVPKSLERCSVMNKRKLTSTDDSDFMEGMGQKACPLQISNSNRETVGLTRGETQVAVGESFSAMPDSYQSVMRLNHQELHKPSNGQITFTAGDIFDQLEMSGEEYKQEDMKFADSLISSDIE